MTIVKGIIRGGARRPVTASLVAPSGWLDDGQTEVIQPVTVQADDVGLYLLELTAQADFEALGTYWSVDDHHGVLHAIVVPDIGPVWLHDILVNPTDLTPVPPPVPPIYVTRAEIGEPDGIPPLVDGEIPAEFLPVTGGGVPATRQLNTGTGLAGGGDLTVDRTIVLDADALASLDAADNAVQPDDLAPYALSTNVAAALATKATKLKMRRASVTSGTGGGNVPPDTGGSWAAFTAVGSLTIPAVIGDQLELNMAFATQPSDSSFWDIAVEVGGSLVWFLGGQGAVPLVEGDSALAPFAAIRTYGYINWLTVAAEHLAGGNVKLVLASKSNNTGKIFLNAADPFRWRVVNFGAVD